LLKLITFRNTTAVYSQAVTDSETALLEPAYFSSFGSGSTLRTPVPPPTPTFALVLFLHKNELPVP